MAGVLGGSWTLSATVCNRIKRNFMVLLVYALFRRRIEEDAFVTALHLKY